MTRNPWLRYVTAIVFSALALIVFAEKDTADLALRLSVDLVDGSRIVGAPAVESVSVKTAFAAITVPLSQITGIRIGDDREAVSFEMRNGDRITGALLLDTIELKTVFGQISIALEHARSISVSVGGRELPASALRGRILHFAFDRDEGRTVANQAGNRHAGEVQGASWTPQGKTGGAYVFNGTSDSIVVKADAELNVSDGMTILAWVKPTDLGRQHNTILTRNFGGGEQYGIRFSGATLYASFFDTRRGFETDQIGPFPENQWLHVAMVFCGQSRQGKVYGNGRALAARTMTDRMRSRISGDLFIGRDNRNTDASFKGKIDEVMIYNRALTDSDIKLIYEAQL